MDKPPLGTTYYYIDLDEDWSQITFASKVHTMDQIDRYNLAAGNWALALDDLEAKADLLLESMTLMDQKRIAELLFTYHNNHEDA